MIERFPGRTAVITGSGSGIGLATARRLAEEGANVVVADIDTGQGQAVADEVNGLFVRTDVTSEEQVQALFAAAAEHYGSVDVAFNNAGSPRRRTTRSSPRASRRGNASRRST